MSKNIQGDFQICISIPLNAVVKLSKKLKNFGNDSDDVKVLEVLY